MTDRPAPTTTALRAATALRSFGIEYKRWVEHQRPENVELTSARLQALVTLSEHGPITMVGLSRHLGTTPHNVTKLIDWLEGASFVERRKDANDRRAVVLHITDQGRDIAHRHAQPHEDAVAEPFTDLTDPQLEQLISLLDDLRTAIRKRLD